MVQSLDILMANIDTGWLAGFEGEAVEHLPAAGNRPPLEVDGWNRLVWVEEAGTWKLAQWQWRRGS